MAGAPSPQGQVSLTGAGIPGNTSRTLYQAGPIAEPAVTTIAIPVVNNVGLGAQAQAAIVLPWLQYRQRVGELKQLVDRLQTDQQQLLSALQGRQSG
jgi:hypothetical protein